jgi:hypothetical protein
MGDLRRLTREGTTIGQDPQWKTVNRTASIVEVKGNAR